MEQKRSERERERDIYIYVCVARKAGYRPCDESPQVPPARQYYTDKWEILMVKDMHISRACS